MSDIDSKTYNYEFQKARAEKAEDALTQAIEVLASLADNADWYRRCLEDVIDRQPVRALAEAREAYDSAYRKARALQESQ